MKLPVWVHQVQTSYVQSGLGTDDAAVPAIGEVWGKVFDGLNFQSTWDRHANAIDGLTAVVEREKMHEADGGREWKPWGVLRGRQPGRGDDYAKAEGELAAAAAKAGAGPDEKRVCIIDLEPHYHGGSVPMFWRDDLGADAATVRAFLNAYATRGGHELWLCLDARPAHMEPVSFPAWRASPVVRRFIPMTYWTDFRQDWRTAIDRTTQTLLDHGVLLSEISHAFPGDATPDDMQAAIEYVHRGGMLKPSVWQRLNLSQETADRIAAMSDPWETPPAPVPAPSGDERVSYAIGEAQAVQRLLAEASERLQKWVVEGLS